jgi:hypothetical protein
LKTAEGNARTLLPRYADLIKAERDKLQTYALSLHADKDTVGKFLDEMTSGTRKPRLLLPT